MTKIIFHEEFIPSRTSDLFVEVEIVFNTYVWEGALPLKLRDAGYSINRDELDSMVKSEVFLNQFNKSNHPKWLTSKADAWSASQNSQTHKVFKALLSHQWECKVCGPVPKVNPQSPARIRSIKKKNFVIATKTKHCGNCAKKTYHDILIPINIPNNQDEGYRKAISSALRKRILTALNKRDCFFNTKLTADELIIDHKFPSQRWKKAETFNDDSMSENNIKAKFQLLTNQSNMLKSRACDKCVREEKRSDFMGINWFYQGDENWVYEEGNEEGCIGCPWYDVDRWRKELTKELNIS